MPMTLQACEARDRGRCRRVVASVMENIPFHPDQNRWVRRRIAETARRVDRFIAMSERARLHLELHGVDPERIVVLPVGTDVERFGPAPLPRDDGRFRVLSVARLEQGKGVEDLAIAAGLLARRGVDVSVTFLGRGPLRGRLERVAAEMGIADRVELPGFVPWGELHEVYRRHDAFVLASGTTRNWRGAARLRGVRGDGERAAGASSATPARCRRSRGGRRAWCGRTTRRRWRMRSRSWPAIRHCAPCGASGTARACSSATTSGRCARS